MAETIKDICNRFRVNQTELSRRFGIPLRTVQDWYSGRRTPPGYLVSMMAELLGKTKTHTGVRD